MNQKIIRTYSDLIRLQTFEERFEYLRIHGQVGVDTFGFDRYLNQLFYTSPEWRTIRNHVVTRDGGCDLAIPELEIPGRIYIHHINPLTKEDILNKTEFLLDPEYLICTTHTTHNAIHYGDESLLMTAPIERKPNDTCPWKR